MRGLAQKTRDFHLAAGQGRCIEMKLLGQEWPQRNQRVRWRVLSEDNLDGRAAIRRTDLLWRNEASDTVACRGEFSSPRETICWCEFARHPKGSLLAGTIQTQSFTQ